jgi:hypothetical protein
MSGRGCESIDLNPQKREERPFTAITRIRISLKTALNQRLSGDPPLGTPTETDHLLTENKRPAALLKHGPPAWRTSGG